MLSDVAKNGILKWSEVMISCGCPSEERMAKGPVAVIECLQGIPCNPCETSCSFGAIHVGDPITNLPVIDGSKCRGCGICVAACPGLAIFVEDSSGDGPDALVSIPYEYLPIPREGQMVKATDRAGSKICDACVVSVRQHPKYGRTAVVTISVPKEHVHEARGISMIS